MGVLDTLVINEPIFRVPDKFSRYGGNEEFQRVNFQCSHQITINFLLVCRVMLLTLSDIWPETPYLIGTLIFLPEYFHISRAFNRFWPANDGPSVEREILTIPVHPLCFLFDLAFTEVVKLLQGELWLNLFLSDYFESVRCYNPLIASYI